MPPRRTLPQLFDMTYRLIDELHAYGLSKGIEQACALAKRDGVQDLDSFASLVEEGIKTKVVQDCQNEVIGDMAKPPKLDHPNLWRAWFIKDFAQERLKNAKTFADVIFGFRNLMEEEPVELRLSWLWPPEEDSTGMPVVKPPAAESHTTSTTSDLGPLPEDAEPGQVAEYLRNLAQRRIVEATEYLILHEPSWFRILAELQRKDPSLVGLGTVIAHEVETIGRRGRPPTGPGVPVTTRVLTVESLRNLCELTQTEARRMWNEWFPEHEFNDETGAQFARDHLSVRTHLARRLHLESVTQRKLSEAEIIDAQRTEHAENS